MSADKAVSSGENAHEESCDSLFSILIVEDEERIAEILTDYLSIPGFKVACKNTGQGVVAQIKSDPPDLLLLDIMLPGVDGLEICREVRKFSSLPIIMISARVEELDRLLGLELGGDDYICKPFSPREVLARVKVVYRRLRGGQAESYSQKLFMIDDAQGRIYVKGAVLDLTRTEFRLLKLLVGRPGRIFARQQLLDLCAQVDQPDQLAMDRVIDSHIKNIRKKLSRVIPEIDVLHSVYGVGYRFEIPQSSKG